MNRDLKQIIDHVIQQASPYNALKKQLESAVFKDGRILVVSVGKAGWIMARCAADCLGDRISEGIVITKYGHSQGAIDGFEIYEAGHPLLDDNGIKASQRVWQLTEGLRENDSVLFLLSGGGSALFEIPAIPLEKLQEVSDQLIRSSAGIEEINTIRKRLSLVKGGRFAEHCSPARVCNYILSDVIGNRLDMVASGPGVPDSSSDKEAEEIIEKYGLGPLPLLKTVRQLDNIETCVIGDVNTLAQSAKDICTTLGYYSQIVSTSLICQQPKAAEILLNKAQANQNTSISKAFIYAGEITMEVTGSGKGGRNQHLALSCARGLKDMTSTTILALGSDGTDGPTEAAGGYVTSYSWTKSRKLKIDIDAYLRNCDSHEALKRLDQLIVTGPTNSNINDLYLILIKR
ncbi:MAG: DUF4147 domain-containing protein [Erysipelotrichaceae bacterium]|nr:DUF4147 domain-containing protein [Erysipelotrichaceae bacterium]